MQLRCTYCQTMFALSRDGMLSALEHMEENKQVFYDAHCPKCRRANRVERARMERFFPDWKKTLREMAKETDAAQAEAKPAAPKPGAVKKAAPAPKPAAKEKDVKPAARAKPAQKAPVPAKAAPKAKPSGAGRK